jgi:hypothetical protein
MGKESQVFSAHMYCQRIRKISEYTLMTLGREAYSAGVPGSKIGRKTFLIKILMFFPEPILNH